MATKTATVQSGQVTGTHTNFPAYVDLADVGVTTLAEAHSIRVYSDAGLTTELAREIVSATEMHVKIPTLTSSTQIWIDYDGVRSDLAVGATYGRNAVWGDYAGVWHMDSTTDSTGNGFTLTANGGVTAGGATGKFGSATAFDGTNDYFSVADNNALDPLSGDWTVSGWANSNDVSERAPVFWKGTTAGNWWLLGYGGSGFGAFEYGMDDASDFDAARGGTQVNNTWFHLVGQYDNTGDDMYLFANGSQVASFLNAGMGDVNSTQSLLIGFEDGNLSGGTGFYFDGEMQELRIRADYLSSNWVTTEYNNQNDNAAFWGTWTDAGGGGATFIPKILSS